jgi:hypothetical protein
MNTLHTVWFQAARLKPDFARFDTPEQAAHAAHNIIANRYYGLPLRVTIRSGGTTTYKFERK